MEENAMPKTGQNQSDEEFAEIAVKRRNLAAVISDPDINDIIGLLGHADLQHLYHTLGLTYQDIQKSESGTSTMNTDLSERRVLEMWRQRNDQQATRETMLDALEKCGNKDAKEKLDDMWKLKDGRDRIPGGSQPCVMGEHVYFADKQTIVTGDQINIQQMVINKGNQNQEQEDTGQFDLEVCRQELITFYKHEMSRVQLLPWCDETRDLNDIYVRLAIELEQKTQDSTSDLAENEDLVTLQTSQDMPASRVLVKGLAGSGKSTLLTKFAFTWSQQKSDSPLLKFKLVFVLSLREVRRGCSLIDAIFQQIFESHTKVPKNGLKDYIETHQNETLVLLDGFDEYSADNLSAPNGDLEEVIIFKALRECRTILSTRPHKDLRQYQSSYLSVKLLGFSSENFETYMSKFFRGDKKLVRGLSKRVGESQMLESLSTFPVILMLLCLLWEDEQQLSNTQSELYQQFTLYLWRKYCDRYGKQVYFDEKDESPNGEFNEVLLNLGKVALKGLLPNEDISEEKIVFSEKDFDNSLFEVGCHMGLLTRERLRSKLNVHSAVTFLHKSFQEFCAGKYWASLMGKDPDQFHSILRQIKTVEAVWSKMEMIKFCCGSFAPQDAHSGLISIVKYAISIQGGSCHHISSSPEFIIFPILNFWYESQITHDDSVIQALKSFMSQDYLKVHLSNANKIALFHRFVKSTFGLATLATTKEVEFDHHRNCSVDVITDTLACMPDVECVTIPLNGVKSMSDDQSKHFVERLGALSKLTTLCLYRDLLCLSDVRPHSLFLNGITEKEMIAQILDTTQIKCEQLDLTNSHVAEVIGHIGRIINHLQILRLCLARLQENHIKTLSEFLPQASNLQELYLSCNNVGMAIVPLAQQLQYCTKLEKLDLSKTVLKEDHIKTLIEFLPKAPNLQELDLSENTVSMAIVPLAQELQYCTKMERLYLTDAQITNQGVIELAERFASLPHLKKLAVAGNDITNSGLDAVFKHMHHLTKLEDLKISATIDNQWSPCVRDCLTAIGESIPEKAENVGFWDGTEIFVRDFLTAMGKSIPEKAENVNVWVETEKIKTICDAASKYV